MASKILPDRFQEKTTAHIRRLAETSPALRKAYFFDPEHEDIPANLDADLFLEKHLTRTKGVVQKYPGRALMLLSYTCAAHCRFCERQDRVGVGLDAEGRLTEDAIRDAVGHLSQRPDVKEIIFSGGDPLTNPQGLLFAAKLLAGLPHVEILRIHTRFPLQLPSKVNFKLMEELSRLRPVFYFSLHIDHPDELTPETEAVIQRLRGLGFILISQSVFLKGINDDVEILDAMFSRLAALGVRPYYIYHCQSIPTTMHFVMRLEDEVAIMTKLRERVSGLAFPQHVLELQNTTGKLLVPTSHWNVDLSTVRDFVGLEHSVEERVMKVQPPATAEQKLHGTLALE
jgi:lysine 2,3-aminomutase